MTYTVNYNLTRTSLSGNTTVQITPNLGCTLPSSVTVSNATLVSYDSITGILVLSGVSGSTSITCECVQPAPARALQDSNSDYITDSNSDYISSAEIPVTALKDANDSYVTDGWGAEIVTASEVKNCLKFYVASQQATPFTVSMQSGKTWSRSLEYCDSYGRWIEWDGSAISGSWDGARTVLYLRGTGNTAVTGGLNRFVITSAQTVMISGNTESLLDWATVKAGQHPTMGGYAFSELFYGCTMINISGLTCGGSTVSRHAYESAFSGCTRLTTPPTLPATTLDIDCYASMFSGCTNLATAPELPAMTMANYCYDSMFNRCTSLTNPPALPATSLATYCYNAMFKSCTGLAVAPELPATSLANYCYTNMFYGCTNLATAPELKATSMSSYCYNGMFRGCTGLTTVPALPATSLATSCYSGMFYDCTNITTIPELKATSIAQRAYSEMFRGCSKIKLSTTSSSTYSTEYRIPSSGTGTIGNQALNNMFYSTGGTFTGTPTINTTYYTSNTIVPATT